MLAALRQRDTAAADLARVLAAWLAVVLLVQAQAALLTLVRGPAHRHVPAAAVQRPVWSVLPVLAHHAAATPDDGRAQHAALHRLAHERGDPHHHAAGDEVALPAEAASALDAAACVLMAALAPLAMRYAWPACAARAAAPVATAGWALLEQDAAPPRRPPRG
jgi:hypothetical protein